MSEPTSFRAGSGKWLFRGSFFAALALLCALAMADGGGRHGGHAGGHGSGHSSDHAGHRGSVSHGRDHVGGHGFGHGGVNHHTPAHDVGRHDAVHHDPIRHDLHPHGHGHFGFGYAFVYTAPYYRDYCNPDSVYYDPTYCARYCPSACAPADTLRTPDDVIAGGRVMRVPLLASPAAPDALP